MPNDLQKISNLTYSERARFATSSDASEAWEVASDLQIENESLTERLWQLEADREEVKSLLKRVSDELDNMRNTFNLESMVETGVLYCEKLTQRAELLLGKDEPKGFH